MKAHWWTCVLCLLCMSAEVIFSTWTVSQEPLSISLLRVNSSIEITCSTSLSDPRGFYLRRGVTEYTDIIFLVLKDGQIDEKTMAPKFHGRIQVQHKQMKEGFGFTVQLSLLGLEDTDFYYCSWVHFLTGMEIRSSNGTVIIVRDRNPQEPCGYQMGELIFLGLTVVSFTAILFLIVAAVIMRCKRFKKQFRPARAVKPPRPARPQRAGPPQRIHHCPYLVTSLNQSTLDFRGIL